MSKNLNKRTLQEEKDVEVQKFDAKLKNKKWNKRDRFKKKLNYKGVKANDPVWHGKNSQIVQDLCNYPFNHMQGFPLRIGLGNELNKQYIPTLAVFGFDWFAGVSDNFKSMLNTAATNIWEFVRSRNAGATNYQAADIFVNIILGALDIVSTTQHCVRAFASLLLYTAYNRLSPRMFIESMGIDFDDLNTNVAVYRGRLNLLIAKASSLVLPKQFPLYDWVASLSSNIYKDRDSDTGREQFYGFSKKVFHVYDPTGDSNGGQVRLMTWKDVYGSSAESGIICLSADRRMKMSVILDILEAQINAIITDEDCNIIMGDLIKAYGSEAKFWALRPVQGDETIAPIYSEEVCAQIHNAVLLPSFEAQLSQTASGRTYIAATALTNTVKQNAANFLVTEFNVKYDLMNGELRNQIDSTFLPDNVEKNMYYLIDSNSSQPSPDEVLNMSRFQNRYYRGSEDASGKCDVKITTASSIILFADSYYVGSDDGARRLRMVQYNIDVTQYCGRASVFDWHPIMYNMLDDPLEGQVKFQPIGDLNNPVSIDGITLSRMHDVDFASLLDIPFTGKF